MKHKHYHAPKLAPLPTPAAESDFGRITHAFFSAKAVATSVTRLGLSGGLSNALMFRFYRSVSDPKKVVMGSFIGDNKTALTGVPDAKDMGEVFDKPIATLRSQDALRLFNLEIKSLTAEKVIEGAQNIQSVEEALVYLPS